MKSLIHRCLVLGFALTMTATATAADTAHRTGKPPVKRIDEGSDTGNGGYGGSLLMNVPHYKKMLAAPWCSTVSGMLADALHWSKMADSVPMARKYLVESTNNIIAALDNGSIEMQPLTYSLLSHMLAVNDVFPHGELGDQSAVIFLYHLMGVAKHVNSRFDVPRYIPMYRNYTQCRHIYCGRHSDDDDNSSYYGPLYADYLSSVKVVLREFFEPALADHPERGNVLDAMASDRWELNALSEILGWIVSDMSSDVFGRRQFECLSIQLTMAKQRLDDYLSGRRTQPFNDRRMRNYGEEVLRDTLTTIEFFETNNRQGC